MNRTFGVFAFLTAASLAAPAAPLPLAGLWDATIEVSGGLQIPFRFEISQPARNVVTGAFFNGDERVRSTDGRLEGNTLTLEFATYAAKLQAVIDSDGVLTGVYNRATYPPFPIRAKRYRPAAEAPEGSVPEIAGAWDIERKDSKNGEAAWKMTIRQASSEVSGAVLRIDGDTGELNGRYQDGKFVLSHFDGARPSMFELKPNADGTLAVLQNGKIELVAVRSAEARAKGLPEPADPTRWTSVKDPSEPFHFSGRDLEGNVVTDADLRFRGKVVLVNITGSWCPNCHDEAPFLAELDRLYRKRGLVIVALSFEEADQLKDPVRLKAYVRNYGVGYTVLLAGEPEKAPSILPQAVNLNTFPATFFLDRQGLVRGSHAGFAGKAMGEAHEHLKAEMIATVERLLDENSRSSK